MTATPTGFRHDIVLHHAPTGDASVTIPVATHGADLSETPAGGLEITNAAGDALASAPAPIMWDSSADELGEPAVAPVDTTVGHTAAGTPTVTLTPDQGFLSAPGTVYPVTIDPAFSTYAGSDTWVATPDNASGNAGTDELRAGTSDAGAHKARSFLWFGGGNTTWAGKNIQTAQLVLRNFVSGSCRAGEIRAARITQPWDAASVTWANQPDATATDAASFSTAYGAGTGCPVNNAVFDVKKIVQTWANDTSTNLGLRVRAFDETDSNTYRRYRSTNYADQALRPRIDVTYTIPDPVPSVPTVSVSGTTATVSSAFTGGTTGTIRFRVFSPEVDPQESNSPVEVFNVVTNPGLSGSTLSTDLVGVPEGDYVVEASVLYDGRESSPSAGTSFSVTPIVSTPDDPDAEQSADEDASDQFVATHDVTADSLNGVDTTSSATLGFTTAAADDVLTASALSKSSAEEDDPCWIKSPVHIVRWYVDPNRADIPLRCGVWSKNRKGKMAGWGYRKLKGKESWNPWFDGMIGAAIYNQFGGVDVEGVNLIYKTQDFTDCPHPYYFRVVVRSDNPDGTLKMRGILTAYQRWLP